MDGEIRGGLRIPGLGSLLARGGFDRPLQGLEDFPEDERPPANVVHWSFQTMVGSGFAMIGIAAWFQWRRRRHDDPFASRRFLQAAVAAGGLSVLALQAGWTTTEVGRQPWIVWQQMRVDEAVTSNQGVWISLAVLVIVYASMGVITVKVLLSMARRWRESDEVDLPTPYGIVDDRERAAR